jgi:hypothetical protein
VNGCGGEETQSSGDKSAVGFESRADGWSDKSYRAS